jgi:hypothetical protein
MTMLCLVYYSEVETHMRSSVLMIAQIKTILIPTSDIVGFKRGLNQSL